MYVLVWMVVKVTLIMKFDLEPSISDAIPLHHISEVSSLNSLFISLLLAFVFPGFH